MIEHHGRRQAADIAHALPGVANGLVQLVIDRRVLGGADRLAGRVERGGDAGCVDLARRLFARPGRLASRGRCVADGRRGQRGGSGNRWLVGQCPRHAARRLVDAGRFVVLLAADAGAFRHVVRTIGLGRLLGLREIDIGRHLHLEVVLAEQRAEDFVYALDDAVFHLAHILDLRRVEPGFGQLAFQLREQGTALVDDGDVGGRQLRHARRNQVRDAGDLPGIQCAAGVQVEHDRGSRLLLLAHENRRLGNGQMDAGRLYRTDRLDGARQLTLQAALVINLFGKLADAELLVFHQFEADHAAAGQTLRSQLQAHLVNPFGRHQQGAGVTVTVRDVLLFEHGGDRAAILFVQIGKKNFPVRLPAPQDSAYNHRDDGGDGHHEDDLLLATEPIEGVAQTLHRICRRWASCCRLGSCCHQCSGEMR